MRLLLDTDAFCKLAVGGVLEEAVHLLGLELTDCGRLPALPHMLRRGRLRRLFGDDTCDGLIPVAEAIPAIVQPGTTWLERLAPLHEIDVGEAQLIATAAEYGLVLMSGDKRALRTLKDVNSLPAALAGRVVALEAALFALCERLGPDEVRRRVQPLMGHDQMVAVCFSSESDPRDGLGSYFESLAAEVAPLALWNPRSRGGE